MLYKKRGALLPIIILFVYQDLNYLTLIDQGVLTTDIMGGMTIGVRDSLRPGVKFIQHSPDKIWIKLDNKFFGSQKDILICFSYISPKSAINKETTFFDEISMEIEKYKEDGFVLVCGDLNAKTNTAPDYVFDTDDQHSPIVSNPLYTRASPSIRKTLTPIQ